MKKEVQNRPKLNSFFENNNGSDSNNGLEKKVVQLELEVYTLKQQVTKLFEILRNK